MQETIESSMFSRRTSVCVYFGWHPIRSPDLYLIGILVRSSFLLVPWSFCRTSIPILIVLIVLNVILLYLRNLSFRIGPAHTCVLVVARSFIYFGTPVMRYAFWHITSILSLSVLASLRVITFGVSRSRLTCVWCDVLIWSEKVRLAFPCVFFESIGFPLYI